MKKLAYSIISSLLTIGLAGQLFGDVITNVSISDDVANSYPSQLVSDPVSATASVSSRSNIASGSSSLNLGASSIGAFTFSDTAGAYVGSQSTTSFDNFFNVTGGTGTGYLALTYNNHIGGFSDGQASASSTLTITENGTSLYNSRVCSNLAGQVSSFNCNNQIPIGFAFTYGQSFELLSNLSSDAGGGLGGSNMSGTGSLSYALLSSPGGQSITGTLNLVPEPSSWLLFLLGASLCARLRDHD